jgi:hypothetical protein
MSFETADLHQLVKDGGIDERNAIKIANMYQKTLDILSKKKQAIDNLKKEQFKIDDERYQECLTHNHLTQQLKHKTEKCLTLNNNIKSIETHIAIEDFHFAESLDNICKNIEIYNSYFKESVGKFLKIPQNLVCTGPEYLSANQRVIDTMNDRFDNITTPHHMPHEYQPPPQVDPQIIAPQLQQVTVYHHSSRTQIYIQDERDLMLN